MEGLKTKISRTEMAIMNLPPDASFFIEGMTIGNKDYQKIMGLARKCKVKLSAETVDFDEVFKSPGVRFHRGQE